MPLEETIDKKDKIRIIRMINNVVENNPELLDVLFTEHALILCIRDLETKIKECFERVEFLTEKLLNPFSNCSEREHTEQLKLINARELLNYYQLYKKYEVVISSEHLHMEYESDIKDVENLLRENGMLIKKYK